MHPQLRGRMWTSSATFANENGAMSCNLSLAPGLARCHKYFDIKSTPNIELTSDIVLKSLQEAVSDFNNRTKEGKNNTWGQYKPLHIYHLTRLPALSAMDLAVDGCPDAINATGQSFGPSWRMVVSLENKIKAYAVYPGGQPGNPTSKYYKNMIPAWSKGEYYNPNFVSKKDELKDKTTQCIQLIASKGKT